MDVKPDGTWEVELTNSEQCRCGRPSPVNVHVACADDPQCFSDSALPLECQECCDEVQITNPTLPCVPAKGGTVSITFSASILPAGCGGTFEWKVTDVASGAILHPFTAGASTFTFGFPGVGTYKVNVRVPQSSDCDDPVLTDSVQFTLDTCRCGVQISGRG
ncbi:MAG: PKD domain-containing protein [Solirubrobacteraceae bacterium]